MTNKTAATRYARALLDVAVKERVDLEHLKTEIASFARLFVDHPTLAKVLLNPAVPVPRKRSAVAELTAQAGTSPMLTKLLLLLAERDRLVLLPDVFDSYSERLLDYQNVVRAEVTTATPLGPDRAKALQDSLAHVTQRTVTLATAVDPTIIGGIIARIGSTIYDGSVVRQLEKMKDRLVESV
jgi:F-type H+-transporting ATPase subunit delta